MRARDGRFARISVYRHFAKKVIRLDATWQLGWGQPEVPHTSRFINGNPKLGTELVLAFYPGVRGFLVLPSRLAPNTGSAVDLDARSPEETRSL